jgi:hypothetical protein
MQLRWSEEAASDLERISLGPSFRADSISVILRAHERAYLVTPTWLSSQAHSNARSRIWS